MGAGSARRASTQREAEDQEGRTANKEYEQSIVDSVLRHLGIAGPPVASEAPDFLLSTELGTIGIEVTGLQANDTDGVNPRQAVRLMLRLVNAAREAYRSLPSAPVDATLRFRRGSRFTQREIPILAQELAAEISLHVIEADLAGRLSAQPRDFRMTHRLVSEVTMWKPQRYQAPHWLPRIAGMVRPATTEDLLTSLGPKERKLPRYRARSCAVWAAVSCDVMADRNFVDPPAERISLRTGFDRVFCVSWNGGQVVEVQVTKAP